MSSTRPPLTRNSTSPGSFMAAGTEPCHHPMTIPAQADPIPARMALLPSDLLSQRIILSSHGLRSSNPSNPDGPIVSIRGSRSPTEDQRAQPDIQVSPSAYSLVAHIGRGFHPECITISAKKGNALVIVADRWDMEKDCRYEWVWRFDRDADMSSVHANYDSGVLRVTVKRIPGYRLGNL
ncbi:hypothetical protein RhiXN_02581 [Rhizoctonia solani]|uniref:SHSP domain-containing protein n=1 Tax=Rhizoctonia solani TaxID=456999 RepID=A0A8H8NSY7_9AGAM|nr:uncharacterized protein RhiXN_02581 [Rhizoctonia solani]QRW17657.1 hypothetical protein RhiXN_02581 [Rhizoctonia solani]